MMRFEFPWAFLLLPVAALVFRLSVRRGGTGTIRFSSVGNAAASGESRRTRFRHLPAALRVAAVVLLTIGLARPQQGREAARDVSEGIAVEMVVDRSGSMGRELVHDGTQVSRLDVVKKVFKEFVLGNGKDLKGRPNDLIGMVAFARSPDTVCPLTLSHGALDHFIDTVRVVTRKNEDGTSIGDAIALAAARLRTAEESLKSAGGGPDAGGPPPAGRDPSAFASLPDRDYEIKSKVIILLTDGQSNAGRRTPEEAAKLAAEWGIKIYAIGIGGRESFMTIRTPLGDYKVPGGPGVDEAALKAVAAATGGAYWMADSGDKLQEIYKEIDKMEKTEIESVRYVDYAERFVPFVLAGVFALCLEQVLLSTVFRRIP